MRTYNHLAEAANKDLQNGAPQIFSMLSERGKAIYFPYRGILGQTAEAKNSAINATIGTAFENDGSPLTLECMEAMITIPSDSFLYAPSFGLQKLREEWGKLIAVKNPGLINKTYSKPVVTSALTHALSVAGYLFVDAGDEIIIPDLYWDNYELVFVEAYGARFSFFNTFVRGGFDVKAFSAALNSGKTSRKIVLLNFPNNPTGYTPTEGEAEEIVEVIRTAAEAGSQVVVVLDDAYFGLVYEEGIYRESLFSMLADLHPNVLGVKLDGATKEDYVWGLRVGFITFGFKGATPSHLKALEDKAAGVVRGSISNAPCISQAMLLKAYADPAYERQKKQKYEILLERVKKIRATFDAHPEYAGSFEVMPFNSGYFMCVRPVGVDLDALRKELITHYDTGVIVLVGLVRLAFSAVPVDMIEKLFANLHDAIKKLQG
ncbi:MAG TPA: aminotransferase class I/II-fold pyridoxal phosphate-dependent enzyme [Acidobacteriota bacterium]|nr:aminotransferase class I/II-fold pyridoxal phosphate-dependent enzyme [Acidobacteriota bacterium]